MEKENKKKKNTSKKNNNKPTQKKGNNNIKKVENNKKEEKNNNFKKVENKKEEKNNKKEVEKVKDKEVKEAVIEEVEVEEKEEILEDTGKTIIEESKDEPTNKKGLIILVILLIAIIGICIYYQADSKGDKADSKVSSEESEEIMDEFYKYFNNKKVKIIYYASSSCGYCELQTPIMEQIAKDYDIDYLYIDSTKLTSSDRKKMLKELDIEQATPTTVVVKNGKVIGTQAGYADGKEMVEFLKEHKVLDKDAEYTPESNLTFINYDEYNKLLQTEGKHIITIGQTGCSHCIATKPVLNTIAKEYNITINYLNITDMTQSERESFTNSLSEIGYDEEDFVESGNFGTPLTLIVENGKVVSYVSGERPTAQFIKAFKKANVISE